MTFWARRRDLFGSAQLCDLYHPYRIGVQPVSTSRLILDQCIIIGAGSPALFAKPRMLLRRRRT